MGLFNKIKSVFSKDKDIVKYDEALTKTRKEFSTKISDLSKKYKNIGEDYFEELEDILIMADIGINTVMKFVDKLKKRAKEENIEVELIGFKTSYRDYETDQDSHVSITHRRAM